MRKLLHICLFVLCATLSAQPPSRWYNKFGGAGIDIGYGVKETYERHYIVAGSTSSFGNSVDAYLILVDSMGQKVWEKTYGGVFADVAKAVVVNPVDSGYIFAGYTGSLGNGGYDVYVVRTNKHGNILWQQSFGGLDWDFGNDIVLAPDGNVVICGYTYNSKYGKKDGYILKVNSSNGALLWEKKYGGTEDDELVSVLFTSDGLYSLCGTKTLNGIDNDFWLLKLSLNGDSILSKSVTSFSTNEKCYDFIENKLNELTFCGALDTTVAMTGSYSSYLLKTDLSGNFISQVSFTNGAHPDEKFTSICNTKNQSYICATRKIQQVSFKLNIYLHHTIDDFTYLSATTYGDFDDEEVFNIENCSDNGYIIAGYTKSYESKSEDVFVVKLDSNLLNSQNIIGIRENGYSSGISEFYYYGNQLHFENPKSQEVTIHIYNTIGQLIAEGISNKSSFDTQIEASGIYFAVIKQGTHSKKLKFIVSGSNK